jgi:hypothetical protein
MGPNSRVTLLRSSGGSHTAVQRSSAAPVIHAYNARYLSPEPLLEDPLYILGEHLSGFTTPTYGYARNNPLAYLDPDGLNPGDVFRTPDEAAQDAFDYLKDRPGFPYEQEFCGVIHKKNGGYSYTAPSPGIKDGCETKTVPNAVASFHNHTRECSAAEVEAPRSRFKPSQYDWDAAQNLRVNNIYLLHPGRPIVDTRHRIYNYSSRINPTGNGPRRLP